MARKKAHEEHTNHEAWAIPYGDLVTLLLALFVVLYSMSSVNEGKYRVLSDSLNEAFGGRPRSPMPIQIGEHAERSPVNATRVNVIPRKGSSDDPEGLKGAPDIRPPGPDFGVAKSLHQPLPGDGGRAAQQRGSLERMSQQVQAAMGELIERRMVIVRQNEYSLEIEIRTDILFPSGVAQISDAAQPVLAKLAGILKPFPNPIRIEGHTDNVPINTMAFPSNWQLSAARAASVVGLFMQQGVDPTRMSVAGFGEYHPATSNDTADGRNRNRRVLIVVLGDQNRLVTAGIGDALADATSGPAADAALDAPAASGPAAAALPSTPPAGAAVPAGPLASLQGLPATSVQSFRSSPQ